MNTQRFIIINLVYNNKPFLSIYIAAIFLVNFSFFPGFPGRRNESGPYCVLRIQSLRQAAADTGHAVGAVLAPYWFPSAKADIVQGTTLNGICRRKCRSRQHKISGHGRIPDKKYHSQYRCLFYPLMRWRAGEKPLPVLSKRGGLIQYFSRPPDNLRAPRLQCRRGIHRI